MLALAQVQSLGGYIFFLESSIKPSHLTIKAQNPPLTNPDYSIYTVQTQYRRKRHRARADMSYQMSAFRGGYYYTTTTLPPHRDR